MPPLLRKNRLGLVFCAHSAISRKGQGGFLVDFLCFFVWFVCLISGLFVGGFDPELRLVLELATDSELYELERILFGPRLVSLSWILFQLCEFCWPL